MGDCERKAWCALALSALERCSLSDTRQQSASSAFYLVLACLSLYLGVSLKTLSWGVEAPYSSSRGH